MNRTTTLALYTATVTYDAEQNPVKTWATAKSVAGNLMPRSLSEAEVALYGISTNNANAKAFYYEPDAAVVIGARLGVYDVLAVNAWPQHGEAILRPY